ncbi:MAG: cation diffusion facilitator family transporter [Chloroflexota bacterium]|nr:cation diffusion facilitator family transporter [Chloroflexota bacterium]
MHNHGPHLHDGLRHTVGRETLRPLAIALIITSVFLVIEVIGGLLTNSLALLADAGHMLTDVAALGLSLFATWLARRPATPRRSFGYQRAEVLAALVNAATLVAISFYIFWEALQRFGAPPEVDSVPMLLVAIAGLGANAASAWVLMRGGGHEHHLNTRSAFLHVVSDILGSVGAITAALIMLATRWFWVDPLLSVAIGVLILRSSWQLMADSVNVLMEATPAHIDLAVLRDAMVAVDGVENVHDIHVRTVTSGLIAMSAHIEITGGSDWHDILLEESRLLRSRFGIAHVTLQPEHPHALPEAFRGCSLDSTEGLQACQLALEDEAHEHVGHEH